MYQQPYGSKAGYTDPYSGQFIPNYNQPYYQMGGVHHQKKTHSDPSQNQKYKTKMCRHFETTGSCTLQDRCSFAHGVEELRKINDVSKHTLF
jgi:hypothetical protein